MREPRCYTIKIDVVVRDQDDLVHFQPDSVTAHSDAFEKEWVSGNDLEAIADLFAFCLREGWMTNEQRWTIAKRAANDASQERDRQVAQ